MKYDYEYDAVCFKQTVLSTTNSTFKSQSIQRKYVVLINAVNHIKNIIHNGVVFLYLQM